MLALLSPKRLQLYFIKKTSKTAISNTGLVKFWIKHIVTPLKINFIWLPYESNHKFIECDIIEFLLIYTERLKQA